MVPLWQVEKFFMKKLDQLIIKSFLSSFLPTFVVVIFILLMQVVWLYVDELVGKGLEWAVIAELLMYFSATIIPQALPLSVLVSSIMTFGNLGESYELIAARSAGVSTMRIFRPMFFVMLLIAFFAFFVANVLIPQANLKRSALLYDVRSKKPALAIVEGIFYGGIEGITMHVGKKNKYTQEMQDIIIYDQRDNSSHATVISAKRGTMSISEDKRFLFFTLYDGARYEEMEKQQSYYSTFPHSSTYFAQEQITFDLNSFKFNRTDEDLFKQHFEMLNVIQLKHFSDSLITYMGVKNKQLRSFIKPYYFFSREDSNASVKRMLPEPVAAGNDKDVLQFFDTDKTNLILNAQNIARTVKNIVSYAVTEKNDLKKNLVNYEIEWHKKIILSVACLVMFFIGAPLGSIIRKGGFGLPLVVSVLLYICYHIIALSGEKAAKTMAWSPMSGMWLAIAVLSPLGLFLTIQASNDSKLFERTAWIKLFKRLIFWKKATL